jgi:hypothetical protein
VLAAGLTVFAVCAVIVANGRVGEVVDQPVRR